MYLFGVLFIGKRKFFKKKTPACFGADGTFHHQT